MDEEKPRKRRTTRFSRSERNKRIVERLREGFGYDEIAREQRLTERRVRQIVKEALEGREALENAIHAHMQIDRLGQAMRVAGGALARGDVRAVAPFIKALEKLDRYQSLAREAAPRRRNMTGGDKVGPADARRSNQTPGSRRVQKGGGGRSGRGCGSAAPGPRSGGGPGSRRHRAAAGPGTRARCAGPGAGGRGSRRHRAAARPRSARQPMGNMGALIRESCLSRPQSLLRPWQTLIPGGKGP
jgi:hypothetical protein